MVKNNFQIRKNNKILGKKANNFNSRENNNFRKTSINNSLAKRSKILSALNVVNEILLLNNIYFIG